jgi:hypothetical protein
MEIVLVVSLVALVIVGVIENGRMLHKWAKLCRTSPRSMTCSWFFVTSLMAGTFKICCGTLGLAMFVLMESILSRLVPSDVAVLIGSIPIWPGWGIVSLHVFLFPEQPFRLAKGGNSITKGPVFLWTIRALCLCFIIICIMFEYFTLTALEIL